MEPGPLILSLLAVLALIAINALCVFNEFALVAIPPARAAAMREEGALIGRLVHRSIEQLDDYIAADQLGITASSIAVGWVGLPAVSQLVGAPLRALGEAAEPVAGVASGVLAFALITGAQMVFGELVPKSIALRYPEPTARLLALPIEVMARILRPATVVLNGIGRLVLRPFGVDARTASSQRSPDAAELVEAAATSSSAGLLGVRLHLVRNAVLFGELDARDIMCPRQDVVGLASSLSLGELLEAARRAPHARYPVYADDSMDVVIGYLNLADLADLVAGSERPDAWRSRVRDITAVFESASVEVVLQILQSQRQQMAVVVDEHGGTEGIVTVADIVRALAEPTEAQAQPPFVVRGSERLRRLEDRLDIELPAERQVSTVNGFLSDRLGRVPRPGDVVGVGGHRLVVLSASSRRAEQVRVERV